MFRLLKPLKAHVSIRLYKLNYKLYVDNCLVCSLLAQSGLFYEMISYEIASALLTNSIIKSRYHITGLFQRSFILKFFNEHIFYKNTL